MLCKRLDLFGNELIAIDGSKFKAVNSKERNYNEKKLRDLIAHIDAKIKKHLEELDRSDEQAEPAPSALTRQELVEKIAQLKERKGDDEELSGQFDAAEKQISTTDPAARLMHTRQGKNFPHPFNPPPGRIVFTRTPDWLGGTVSH